MTANPFEVALVATRLLERLGIPYVIVGSAASSLHGEPRATLDIDLVVLLRASQLDAFCQGLDEEFHVDRAAFREALRTGLTCNAIHRTQHVKLDFYVRSERGVPADECRRARRLRLTREPGSEANVASAEDTVVQKLVWYRKGGEVSDRQWRDVIGVLKVSGRILERGYLRDRAAELGVLDLLERAAAQSGLEPFAS